MYTFQSRVRYSEVDNSCSMDLYSILNYFQDCSNFHSEDVGVGIEYLRARHQVWLLSSWQVELVDSPKLFDQITIGTWPYDFKGLYGYRNFVLYNDNKDHTISAYANSIWFLMDTNTMKPMKVTDDDIAAYPVEPPYPMEYAARKITLPKDSDSAKKAYTEILVSKTMLDSNNHVNNAQYVRLAQSCLPEGFLVRGMRAEYRKSALLGDIICPMQITSADSAHCHILLNDPKGQTFAVIEFHS